MYPSNPAQPPKPPPVNPQGREIPGVTKRPIAPMRGQAAPAVDYKQAAAMKLAQQAQSSAPAGASSMQAPARSAMLQAPGQPAPARAPMQSQAPQQAPQQSMMAKAAASMAGRQSAGPAMDLSADAAQQRQAAALALQRQQQGPVGPKTQALLDSMFQSAMGGLTNREVAVDGREWDPSVGGVGAAGRVGAWVPQGGDAALPPGVRGGDPGTYLENGTWVYDPEKAAANAISISTSKTAEGNYEDYLMPADQRAEQEDAIQRAAAQAMRQQAQMMAARGMGGSGVELMGLGDINANVLDAMNDMNAADRAQAIEQLMTMRGQDYGAFGQSRATGMSEEQQAIENARYDEESAYAKEQEALANTTTALNNYMGFTQSDAVSPEVYAAAMGVDLTDPAQAEAFRQRVSIVNNDDGTRTVVMTQTDPNAKPESYKGASWPALTDEQKQAVKRAEQEGVVALDEMPPDYEQLATDAGIPIVVFVSSWAKMSEAERADYWARHYARQGGGA